MYIQLKYTLLLMNNTSLQTLIRVVWLIRICTTFMILTVSCFISSVEVYGHFSSGVCSFDDPKHHMFALSHCVAHWIKLNNHICEGISLV